MARTRKARIKAIPSTEPAARDEGPRLIPLGSDPSDIPMDHYLQLADTALGTAGTAVKRARKAAGAKKTPSSTLEQT